MVFATGNPHTKLMLIGKLPDIMKKCSRSPLWAVPGKTQPDIKGHTGLSRDMVYISNIVKFRPALPNRSGPCTHAGRIEACLPIIMHEIRVIQPKMIVALGVPPP